MGVEYFFLLAICLMTAGRTDMIIIYSEASCKPMEGVAIKALNYKRPNPTNDLLLA